MENKINEQFRSWEEAYKRETNTEHKALIHQRMVGFIIALELTGNNQEANICKDIFETIK